MNKMPDFIYEPTGAALINGEWIDGTGGSFDVRNPHDNTVLNTVGIPSLGEVDAAVAAAKAAQPGWAAVPTVERAKIMGNIHKLFLERAEPIAQMLCKEIGKTITDSREEVYEYSAPSWAKAAEEILRHRGVSFPSTQEQTNNKRLRQSFRPLGVVAAITPYNFPTDISSIALAHIGAAGNTVIWKPSEYAAVCCAMLADVMKEAGLPDGVLNLIHGKGDVGNALVEHKDVKGVFFTGSTATGRKIAENARCARIC